GVDHEVLAQHRHVDPCADGVEVVEGPSEATALGEHADGARTVVGVDRGEVGGGGDRGQRALRGAGALDLGDQSHGGLVRAQGAVRVPGRGGRGDELLEIVLAAARAAGFEVLQHSGDDL